MEKSILNIVKMISLTIKSQTFLSFLRIKTNNLRLNTLLITPRL